MVPNSYTSLSSPAFLSANVDIPLKLTKSSPIIPLEESIVLVVVVASYILSAAIVVTVISFAEIVAVSVAVDLVIL